DHGRFDLAEPVAFVPSRLEPRAQRLLRVSDVVVAVAERWPGLISATWGTCVLGRYRFDLQVREIVMSEASGPEGRDQGRRQSGGAHHGPPPGATQTRTG